MKKFYDSEFHFSPEENELKRVVNDVAELTDPFYDEYGVSREPKRVIYDEYAQGSGPLKQSEEGKSSKLRKHMLVLMAAVIALLSVVTAAVGADPLGADMLNGGKTIMAPGGVLGIVNAGNGNAGSGNAGSGNAGSGNAGSGNAGNGGSDNGGSAVAPGDDDEDDVFPTLGNLDPDFAGNYAWSGTGPANSEEYIRFKSGGDYTFLVLGGAWASMGYTLGTSSSASYDRGSNTLTLTNFHASVLDMNLMGNGFTIKLEGDSSIDQLMLWGAMYGGSVTFTGSGSLALGGGGSVEYGLLINGEASQSCVMVKKGVKLDIYGSSAAIMVADSTMDPAIYVSKRLTVTGGEITSALNDYGYNNCTVLGADGNPATHVTIE